MPEMDDLISRQAVDTLVDELARAISDERCCISRGRSTATIMQDILDLPTVTPKPKTGYWIKGKYRDTCSECRYTTKADRVMGDIVYDFCPFCGVKMIGSEE